MGGGVKWSPIRGRPSIEDRRFDPPAERTIADAVDGRRLMGFTPPAALGPFTFPGYGTQGIRLTNASNAPQGCHPRIYPYWSVVNNHRGQGFLYVIVGRIGLRPILLRVNKASGEVILEAEIHIEGTAEGWYFSDTLRGSFYFLEGPRLKRFDVFDGRTVTIFTLDTKYGHHLWQAHSSSDDQTHSATVKDANNQNIGAVVYRDGSQIFTPALGDFDECIVDKSGRWLIIQENNENRIIDSKNYTREALTITNAQGALAHLDVGHGFMVGEDDSGSAWQMARLDLAGGPKRVLRRGSGIWGNGMGHVAVRESCSLLSENATGDLVSIAHDETSMRAVAPGMIDGHDYDHQLRACLDPAGEYACWIANVDGRFDAFLVRLSQSIVLPPTKPEGPLVMGSQAYPDEPTWWEAVLKEIGDIYEQKGHAFNLGMFKWSTRISYDIGTGMEREKSRRIHIAELKAELGA